MPRERIFFLSGRASADKMRLGLWPSAALDGGTLSSDSPRHATAAVLSKRGKWCDGCCCWGCRRRLCCLCHCSNRGAAVGIECNALPPSPHGGFPPVREPAPAPASGLDAAPIAVAVPLALIIVTSFSLRAPRSRSSVVAVDVAAVCCDPRRCGNRDAEPESIADVTHVQGTRRWSAAEARRRGRAVLPLGRSNASGHKAREAVSRTPKAQGETAWAILKIAVVPKTAL